MAALAGFSKSALAEQSESKIKSCLSSIYIAQDYFHRVNGRFSATKNELTKLYSCTGLEIKAEYADQKEFRFVATADSKTWAVDESKRIEEVIDSDLN
jgi:hypothetical protein